MEFDRSAVWGFQKVHTLMFHPVLGCFLKLKHEMMKIGDYKCFHSDTTVSNVCGGITVV